MLWNSSNLKSWIIARSHDKKIVMQMFEDVHIMVHILCTELYFITADGLGIEKFQSEN